MESHGWKKEKLGSPVLMYQVTARLTVDSLLYRFFIRFGRIMDSGKIAAIDLFCGIGGLTHGLENSGINVVAGFDIDGSCRYAYEKNNSARFFERDVRKLRAEELLSLYPNGAIRMLAGCAPCQPFSTVTKLKYVKPENENEPLRSFARLIRQVLPDIVTMENVPNLRNRPVFKRFVRTLERNGYAVWYDLIFAPDYGVPQQRRRLVLLASRLGGISLVPPTHAKSDYPTVRQYIGNLQKIEAGEASERDPIHRSKNLLEVNKKRIRMSRPNGTWKDWDESSVALCHRKESGSSYKSVYGRMAWNAPSPTITTEFYNYGSGRFGHPEQDRAISIREGALLQTFPLGYEFVPEGQPIYFETAGRWIGNAVPVKLAESIGLSILKSVKDAKRRLHPE